MQEIIHGMFPFGNLIRNSQLIIENRIRKTSNISTYQKSILLHFPEIIPIEEFLGSFTTSTE